MGKVIYSFATDKDIPAIKKLLGENKLPFEDIDVHITHFIVAKESDIIIGSAGLELLVPNSLLRSVVVNNSYRNIGIANELLRLIIEHAKNYNVKNLYLLTTTAEFYFSKKGFEVFDRKDLPDKIKATKEFQSLCPSTAICMHKNIN